MAAPGFLGLAKKGIIQMRIVININGIRNAGSFPSRFGCVKNVEEVRAAHKTQRSGPGKAPSPQTVHQHGKATQQRQEGF
jgi:hypothetical protein